MRNYYEEGYNDAYYGKDKEHMYTGEALKEYLEGQEAFWQDLMRGEDER